MHHCYETRTCGMVMGEQGASVIALLQLNPTAVSYTHLTLPTT